MKLACLILLLGLASSMAQSLQVGDHVTVKSQNPLILLGDAQVTAINQNMVAVKSGSNSYTFDSTKAEISLSTNGFAKANPRQFVHVSPPVVVTSAEPTPNQPEIIRPAQPAFTNGQIIGYYDPNPTPKLAKGNLARLYKEMDDRTKYEKQRISELIAQDKAKREAELANKNRTTQNGGGNSNQLVNPKR